VANIISFFDFNPFLLLSVRGAPVTSYPTISILRTHFFALLQVLSISHVSLMTTTFKSVPLVAPGHTRPVTHLSFSPLQVDKSYLLISSCKDGNPMLRDWTGDWIGTFIGHKGAVWSSKISTDTSIAASGSADFTAYASSSAISPNFSQFSHPIALPARSGIPTPDTASTLSHIIISSEQLPCHPLRPVYLPADKRKRSGSSTSTAPMLLQITWKTPMVWLMRERSRASSGWQTTSE
jgi:hypothetical protein